MRHFPCFLLLLCIGCSDLKPLPLVDNAAVEPPRSAIQQMIRLQLNSQMTEAPPAPTPGSETERLGILQSLPNQQGGGSQRMSGGGSSGTRTP
ncbi:MAG: hypothetical protein JWR10_586 [Rubritepida sp.]|nr:hypothetical protein [Rubritepida sp.]